MTGARNSDPPAGHVEDLRDWLRERPERPAAVVFEQLDREHDDALAQAQRQARAGAPGEERRDGVDADDPARLERLLDAARFDRQAWRWPAHRPLFEAALAGGARWIAANFSRASARRLRGEGGASVDPALQALIDAPHFDGLPTKISKDPRDHEELLALQKQTGACLFLYFKNPYVTSESGLCGWYEKHVAGDMGWRKAMRYYLQMEITLPGKQDAQELAALYRVTKTPALLVVQPGSTRPGRLWPFVKNPGEDMKLKEMDAILQELKAASTPAYAELF